ncbi:MAG: hypothetical protein A3G34_08885 [Candidatus Lindowbacteria bacterium RIFCSPLOWO2_12_FULL_62_27]|nr:MAG: hypothetical protein A3I06_08740 [Candidatus Lindowbacteria bacterium RIFCSPLOWO2_02_FULL_62_12]OGH60812.1 MAG: hypothetical protein A3G34_08885 [Candidatus Lindowbacteria bacterium RIFCSPLOWO2_12_FULL_62_27]
MKRRRLPSPRASDPARPILRILDANFNRALEGCRVVEDVLRLGGPRNGTAARGPSPVSGVRHVDLKVLRHRISFLRSKFGLRRLVGARDVESDPGAFLADAQEKRYPSYHALLAANLQRLKESLRVIEEVGRTLPARRLFEDAKRLRFQAYALEEKIISATKKR